MKSRSKTCKCERAIWGSEESRVHFVPEGDDLLELMDLKQMDDRLLKLNEGAYDLLPALTNLEAKWIKVAIWVRSVHMWKLLGSNRCSKTKCFLQLSSG